jgi:hypothetical protein
VCEAYTSLTQAFKKRDFDALNDVIEKHAESFADDGNFGLVSLLRDRMCAVKVCALARTYSTLEMNEIAQFIRANNASEAEAFVYRMIKTGQVAAKIDGVRSVVHFHDQTEEIVAKLPTRLEQSNHAFMELAEQIRTKSEALLQNKKILSASVESDAKKLAFSAVRMTE